MNVTAATTEAELIAPVIAARADLAREAAQSAAEATENPSEFYPRGESLVGLAQNVATAEALMSAQLGYLKICKNQPKNRVWWLLDLVSRGADDSWSGRRNDSNRSCFDAVRAWASSQVDSLRHEEN